MDSKIIGNALQAHFDKLGITQVAIAEKLGVSKAYVNSLFTGKRPFGKKQAEIWENTFGISRVFLLSGEGEMLKSSSLIQDVDEMGFSSKGINELNKSIRNGDVRMVPLINIDSVGGIHSKNLISPDEQYVMKMMPFTEARPGDVAILQSGNSMFPTIPPGSVLLIREVVDWREYFGYGNIYVLWLRDGRRITKEVRRYDADPQNYIWCVSYNSDVADEELPKSMIRGVWKVVKYIADFGW